MSVVIFAAFISRVVYPFACYKEYHYLLLSVVHLVLSTAKLLLIYASSIVYCVMQDSVGDLHVVCGCLKDFLRNLKEPLIPTSLWTSFVNAAHVTDDLRRSQAVRGAVKLLPAVNRDSMAFLIIHLQRFV